MPNATTEHAPERRDAAESSGTERPTLMEMVGEVGDLGAGLAIVLLPLFLTAMPGVILFLILPAVLLLAVAAAPVAVAGAIVVPPYLLVRFLRRRAAARRGDRLSSPARRTQAPPPAGWAGCSG